MRGWSIFPLARAFRMTRGQATTRAGVDYPHVIDCAAKRGSLWSGSDGREWALPSSRPCATWRAAGAWLRVNGAAITPHAGARSGAGQELYFTRSKDVKQLRYSRGLAGNALESGKHRPVGRAACDSAWGWAPARMASAWQRNPGAASRRASAGRSPARDICICFSHRGNQ